MKGNATSHRLTATARRHKHVGRLTADNCLVNLAGNYDYLDVPYYISQDYENDGRTILPSCEEMLDAYIPPVFLEKARSLGIPVPEFFISNGYFEPPVIIDPVNPFTLKGKVVLKSGRVASIGRSLTRNFTYAVCCQELLPGSRIVYFRSVLGWTARPQYRSLSEIVWHDFHIPLARVRAVLLEDSRLLLSDISPLPFDSLNARELRRIEELVLWDS